MINLDVVEIIILGLLSFILILFKIKLMENKEAVKNLIFQNEKLNKQIENLHMQFLDLKKDVKEINDKSEIMKKEIKILRNNIEKLNNFCHFIR